MIDNHGMTAHKIRLQDLQAYALQNIDTGFCDGDPTQGHRLVCQVATLDVRAL